MKIEPCLDYIIYISKMMGSSTACNRQKKLLDVLSEELVEGP